MGNLGCQTCDCNDNKEVVTKELTYEKTTPASTAEGNFSSPRTTVQIYSQQHVIRLQALWKGYIVRKAASHLLRQSVPNHNYFPAQDSRETLSRLSGPGTVRTKRAAHRYKSGGVYTGEWLGGFRDGLGEMVWPDTARYSGCWSYGRPFGQGEFRHINGETFRGNWSHCRVKPRDIFFTNGNIRLEEPITDGYVWLICKQDEFRRNPPKLLPKINSFGRLLVESKLKNLTGKQQKLEGILETHKEKFAGEHIPSELLETGKREFKQHRYKNGNIYIGEWLNGKRDGNGKHIWSNGDVYSGEWKDDMQHGWGKSDWIDGSCYKGSYVKNIKEGTGEYIWKDNSKYIGEWRSNEMDGHGEYHWTDGRKYIGSWKRSKMEGYGVFFWLDGRQFEGNWKKSLKHGDGVMRNSDGTVSHETWRNGKVVSKSAAS